MRSKLKAQKSHADKKATPTLGKKSESSNSLLSALQQELDSKTEPPFWVLKSKGLTKSSYKGYKDSSLISSYSETSNLSNLDFKGKPGLNFSNLYIKMKKNETCLELFKKYSEKLEIKSLEIVQVGFFSQKLMPLQSVLFEKCKILSFKILEGVEVEFEVDYMSKTETFITYEDSGKKKGSNVVKFKAA